MPVDKQGDRNRIFQLWQEATKKPKVREPQKYADLPPGGTFDLSQSTITVGGVNYEIPTSLNSDALAKDFGPVNG